MKKIKIFILCLLLLFNIGCTTFIPSDYRIKARAKYTESGFKCTRFYVEFTWGFSQGMEEEEQEKYRTDQK